MDRSQARYAPPRWRCSVLLSHKTGLMRLRLSSMCNLINPFPSVFIHGQVLI
jgi:hypothetical protein